MLEDVSSIVSSAFSIPARTWEGEARQGQEGLKKRDGEQWKAQLSWKWPWLWPGSKALPGYGRVPAVLAGCWVKYHQHCSVDAGGIDLPSPLRRGGLCFWVAPGLSLPKAKLRHVPAYSVPHFLYLSIEQGRKNGIPGLSLWWGWFLNKWAVSEVCLKCKDTQECWCNLEVWRAEEKSQLLPVSVPHRWYVMQSAQDWIKHSTFFFLHGSYGEKKNKEKDTATAMKQVHLRQDMKDFIGWSTQQPYLSLQGTLNWAASWVLLKPLVPQLWVGLWLLEGTKKLGYLTAQPCLSSSVVFPRCGERKGTTTLSRLACTARALLYPPLPNTARAALWDLTNPLLFQGLRVLAVLLIPPAPFFLWLLMLERIGLYILRDFLQSSLSGTLGRFALMVPTFVSAPLRDLSEFQYLSALL